MSQSPKPRRAGPPHRPEVRRVVERQREVSAKLTREEQMAGFRAGTSAVMFRIAMNPA